MFGFLISLNHLLCMLLTSDFPKPNIRVLLGNSALFRFQFIMDRYKGFHALVVFVPDCLHSSRNAPFYFSVKLLFFSLKLVKIGL